MCSPYIVIRQKYVHDGLEAVTHPTNLGRCVEGSTLSICDWSDLFS